MNRELKILIADDSASVRAGLRTLLGLMEGVEVSGEAANGHQAFEMAVAAQPDVVIMDLEMEHKAENAWDGCQAIRRIKAQAQPPRIFVLTVHAYLEAERLALQAGADAIFIKGRDSEKMLSTLRDLALNTQNLNQTQKGEMT